MNTPLDNVGSTFPPNPFFQEMEGVFGAIKSDDGDRASALLSDAVDGLPQTTREYLHPWYCLLAAQAADLLRKRVGNKDIFFPDKDINSALSARDLARRVALRFEAHTKPTPLSTAVIRFLKDARAQFVEDCMYVIDWKKYEELAGRGSAWQRLQEIPKTDKNYDACWSIYSD